MSQLPLYTNMQGCSCFDRQLGNIRRAGHQGRPSTQGVTPACLQLLSNPISYSTHPEVTVAAEHDVGGLCYHRKEKVKKFTVAGVVMVEQTSYVATYTGAGAAPYTGYVYWCCQGSTLT